MVDHTFIKAVLERQVKLSSAEWELFSSFIEPFKLSKKDFMFREGDVLRYLAFVNKGCLRYYVVDPKGNEHIVYFAFEGWWIGDMDSFFQQKPTIYYMQALEDCELFLFNLKNFNRAIDETGYGQFFKKATAQSYTATQRMYAELNTLSAEERYLKLVESKPQIFERIPHHLIASYLGIKPQSLSRIRKQLSTK
jgi:CRP-like cAMP-binding protein